MNNVIEHIAKIGLRLIGDAGHVEVGELVAHFKHAREHMLEVDGFAAQPEYTRDVFAIERVVEQLPFHHQDFVGDLLDDWKIAVDDAVQHFVHRIFGAVDLPFADAVGAASQLFVEARLHAADGDDASLGQEDTDVRIFDLVADQRGRLGGDEHMVGIEVDLGRLRRAHRVFDGKFVKAVDALKLGDLLPVVVDDVDPDEALLRWLGQGFLPGPPDGRRFSAVRGVNDAPRDTDIIDQPSSIAAYCGLWAAKSAMKGQVAMTRAPSARSLSKTARARRVP